MSPWSSHRTGWSHWKRACGEKSRPPLPLEAGRGWAGWVWFRSQPKPQLLFGYSICPALERFLTSICKCPVGSPQFLVVAAVCQSKPEPDRPARNVHGSGGEGPRVDVKKQLGPPTPSGFTEASYGEGRGHPCAVVGRPSPQPPVVQERESRPQWSLPAMLGTQSARNGEGKWDRGHERSSYS